MADGITKVDRFSVDMADQPGEGARILGALAAGKADLLAAWGYPLGSSGMARLELVPKDSAVLRAAAKKAGIKLQRESAAFHLVARDKIGAVAAAVAALAGKGINIHALQAASAGARYGCLIEVDAKDVRKAAKALGA